jgi:hypothetical protein
MNDRDLQHLPCCRVEEQLPEKAGFSRSVMSCMRLAIATNCAFCLEAFRPGGDVWTALDSQFVRDQIATLGFLGEWLRTISHPDIQGGDAAFAALTQVIWQWPGPSNYAQHEVRPLSAEVAASPPKQPVHMAGLRAWLADVGLAPDLVYLSSSLLGDDREVSERTARFYLIEPEHASFWNAWFHVSFVPAEEGRALPDAARMLGIAIELPFLTAVAQARIAVIHEGLLDPSLDVLWWIRIDGNEIAPRLTDSSVGLAAAMAMAERSHAVPPRNWVFSGSVKAFHGHEIANPQRLVRKHEEFASARQAGLLIVPKDDLSELRNAVGEALRGIRGVGTVNEALALASNPTARSALLLPFGDPEMRLVSPWNIEQLHMAAEQATSGTGGGVALVVGDAGMGKGALLRKLYEELEADGWLLAQHRCDPHRPGRRVFAPFRDLLTQLYETLTEPGDREYAGRLAALLNDLEAPGADSVEADRFRVRRGSIGRRLFERIADVLSDLATTRPIAVLLDDLHWTDETSASLFVDLAHKIAAGGQPLLLVGGIRPMKGEGRLLGDELEAMRVELADKYPERFRDVDMGVLSQKQTEWVVRKVLEAGECADPDPLLVDLLRECAGANIFNLQLTVNWLHGTGKLLTERDDWALIAIDIHDVPEIDRIIDWFVAGAGPETKEVLRYAAVIGHEFDLDLLRRAMQREATDLEMWLEQSELVWLLDNEDKSRRDYRFVHPRVASWLRRNLDQDTRRLLHSRVARAYESRLGEEGVQQPHLHQGLASHESVCYQLAFHWKKAERQDLAAPHWAHQAALNRRVGAYHTALRDRQQELVCRSAHTPEDAATRAAWLVSVADAHIDRAATYRLRGQIGDLDQGDAELAEAWAALEKALGTKGSVAPELVIARLSDDLGSSWLLSAAQAGIEEGEAARLRGRYDAAQTRLETAMHWGEWLLSFAGAEHAGLRQRAARVLAQAGCSLMSLYMGRAMHYLRYEPAHEDIRRAQEVRLMFLSTRLWALNSHLRPGNPRGLSERHDSSNPLEAAELRVRLSRMRGNVYFRLESHARLAFEYYEQARKELRAATSETTSAVGAPVGYADRDVHNGLATLWLSLRDLAGARREVAEYRRWAQSVGARTHQASADYIDALIHTVAATTAETCDVAGDLDQASDLLDAALRVPLPSYPELRLRALLLRRWVAARQGRDDDPARFDPALREILKRVWGHVPAHLLADPEAHLLHDVLPEAPWWVREQLEAKDDPQLFPLLCAARAHEARLAMSWEARTQPMDLADEMKPRARARVSQSRFRDHIQAVERKVAHLCAIHATDDATTRVLRCAVWVHDCMREMTDFEFELLAREWDVVADPLEYAHPSWLHGLLGFRLVERELASRLDDEEPDFRDQLCKVVMHHSWPGPDITPVGVLFFVACQLVTLERVIRHSRSALHQLRGSSRDLEAQRAVLRRELERAQETHTEVARLAAKPGTLGDAMVAALRWMVAGARDRGEAIHPRTLRLLGE